MPQKIATLYRLRSLAAFALLPTERADCLLGDPGFLKRIAEAGPEVYVFRRKRVVAGDFALLCSLMLNRGVLL